MGSLVGAVVVDGAVVVPLVLVVERDVRPRLLRVDLPLVLVVAPVVPLAVGRSEVVGLGAVVLGVDWVGVEVLGDIVVGEADVLGSGVVVPVGELGLVVLGLVEGDVLCVDEPVVPPVVPTPGLVWAIAAVGSVSTAAASIMRMESLLIAVRPQRVGKRRSSCGVHVG